LYFDNTALTILTSSRLIGTLKKMEPNYMPHKFLLFAFSLIIFSTPGHAETPPEKWFQIEYVLFEHLNSDRHVLRFEDVKYDLPVREQYYYLTSNENAPSPYQLTTIAQSESDFVDVIKRVSASRELKVYSSGSWQQAIQRGEQLPPLKITGGQSYNEGERFQLEGELQIRRERYMHVDIDVFLSDFTSLPYTDLKNWVFESDTSKWPLNWLLSPLAYQHPALNKAGESLVAKNTIHFKQSRRIKDTEIHYIDHPALGLLVTIKKIETPFKYGENAEGFDS